MTITYNGSRFYKSGGCKRSVRTATIYYNQEDNFDCQAAEYVMKVLAANGWTEIPCGFSGSFDIEVEDRDEYNDLLQVYKSAKKAARLEAKSFPKQSSLYFPYL